MESIHKELKIDGKTIENNNKTDDNKETDVPQNDNNLQKKLLWVGNSISKALDKNKFEKELSVKLSTATAYCVNYENEAKYPDINFMDVVPKAVEKSSPDVVVLQAGSIEITDLKTNAAMMDTSKAIEEYRKEWFEKIQKSSEELFEDAEKVTKNNPNIKVIIIKRLPRFDRSSDDLLKIKAQLSEFGNSVYQQMWYRKGSPANIHFVDVNLGCANLPHLKNIIYGNTNNPAYDGVHLLGEGAERHFNYRLIQAIKPIIINSKIPSSGGRPNNPRRISNPRQREYLQEFRSHAYKMRQLAANHRRGNANINQSHLAPNSYSEAVKSSLPRREKNSQVYQYKYAVPTFNKFDHLN